VGGAPAERVWASWALALALGRDFIPQAEALTRAEPEPGVRRHLIVILAGAGERAAVRALAAHDPDPYVRATAHRYLLLAAPEEERNDTIAGLLTAASSDASATTREECVRLLAGRWPRDREPDVAKLLEAPVDGIRAAAMELLLEPPVASSQAGAVARQAIREAGPTRTDWWTRLVHAGRAESILEFLPTGRAHAYEALALLAHQELRWPWELLRARCDPAAPEIEHLLLNLLASPSEADLEFLADRAARGMLDSKPGPINHLGERSLRALLEKLQDDPGLRPATEAARRDVGRLATARHRWVESLEESIRQRGADARFYDDDDDGEDDPTLGEQLQDAKRELAALRRALGAVDP